MLAQVKSGFSMVSATRGPPAPTFVASSTSADSANVSMPGGIASGDIGIFLDNAHASGGTPPTDTLPSGWTRIGTTLTDTGGALGNAQRLNMAYKVLDGTETTLTGMTGNLGSAKTVFVFRKAATQTWGAPADVEAQVDNDSCTAVTINVGTAPLIVIGFVYKGGSPGVDMSPAATAEVSNSFGNGYLNAGYIIYGSGAVDNVNDIGGRYAGGGFYVALT